LFGGIPSWLSSGAGYGSVFAVFAGFQAYELFSCAVFQKFLIVIHIVPPNKGKFDMVKAFLEIIKEMKLEEKFEKL